MLRFNQSVTKDSNSAQSGIPSGERRIAALLRNK